MKFYNGHPTNIKRGLYLYKIRSVSCFISLEVHSENGAKYGAFYMLTFAVDYRAYIEKKCVAL